MWVGRDSLQRVTLNVEADQSIRPGSVSDLVMDGDNLRWRQEVSGTSCEATAVLTPATSVVPAVMKGKMACQNGDITFTLHKKTG